jgi:hypothetical protein
LNKKIHALSFSTENKQEKPHGANSMDAITLLRRVKACFAAAPECDARANIGPRTFLVSLIFAFTSNDHTRSLDAIRQSIVRHTGISPARSSFWQRFSSKRLTTLLKQTVALMIKNLAPAGVGPLKELAENIGVKDILYTIVLCRSILIRKSYALLTKS